MVFIVIVYVEYKVIIYVHMQFSFEGCSPFELNLKVETLWRWIGKILLPTNEFENCD